MSYTNPTPEEVEERRAELAPFDLVNERVLLALWATILVWQGPPRTYLDLGSGTGAMVNMSRKLGIDAYGVDLINGPEHWFVRHDLSEPLQLFHAAHTGDAIAVPESGQEHDSLYDFRRPYTFDLITCLEVGEHLSEDASDVLCDTIARHMHTSSLLVFSAAIPGQAGEHHINLQPPTYWRSKLYERGVSYRADFTAQLSHLWAWTAGPLSWLAANVQVFDK